MTKHIRSLMLVIAFMSCGYAYGESGRKFCLVTDASTLQEGDTIIIVNKSHNKAMSIKVGGTSVTGSNIEWDGNCIIATDSTLLLTLEKSSSKYWTFKMPTGYYLCCNSSNNRSLSKSSSTKTTDYCKATISIDSENSKATVVFNKKTNYQIHYKWDTGSDSWNVFKLYEESMRTDDGEVYIYTSTPRITLDGDSQTADNSSVLDGLQDGVEYDITVERTFIGDGGWYTLCLPFALTADDIAETFCGAEFYGFTSVTKGSNGEASLNFEKAEAAEAAKPYLVMFPTDVTVENPVIKGKKIIAKKPQTTTFTYTDEGTDYSFVGIFDPFSVDVYPTAHFVSSNGKSFVKPNDDGTKLKGLRAYFLMPDSSTEAKLGVQGTPTGIGNASNSATQTSTTIFTIDGKRLNISASGLSHGAYIINGKKTLIK